MPDELPPLNGGRKNVPAVPFYKSHRFWAMVAALGTGLPISGYAVSAGVALLALNPIAGVMVMTGAALSLVATAGLAWCGITSNRNVQFIKPNGNGGK